MGIILSQINPIHTLRLFFVRHVVTLSPIMFQETIYPACIFIVMYLNLTEMSTRNLPGGKGRPPHKAGNLTATCEPIV
jgi:hypothetical protein